MLHPASRDPIQTPSGLPLYHKGPSLDSGPHPAFFYFALSGSDSLNLDPFNQPVTFLEGSPIHIFSSSLPLHGSDLKNTEAIPRWANAIRQGEDIIGTFVDQCRQNLDFVIDQGWVDPQRIAFGGLSRGGYIATLLAGEDSRIKIVLGYAPLTQFDLIAEFHDILDHPNIQKWKLDPQKLKNKILRYYVGNLDMRISTEACFLFFHNIAKAAQESGIRVPQIELISFPSIGYKGHGTPPKIFKDGINWLKETL